MTYRVFNSRSTGVTEPWYGRERGEIRPSLVNAIVFRDPIATCGSGLLPWSIVINTIPSWTERPQASQVTMS